MGTLQLGICNCEPLRVDKTDYISFGEPKQIMEIENGSTTEHIIIRLSTSAFNTFHINYAKYNDLYYYVSSPKFLDGSMCEIELSIDTLMSYKNYILSSTQFVERNEKTYNFNITDTQIPIEVETETHIIKSETTPFTTDMGKYNYVLQTVGRYYSWHGGVNNGKS